MSAPSLIAVGTSAGGLHALGIILGRLPATLGVPVVVVQHRATGSHDLASVLQDSTTLVVVEAEDKLIMQDGHVYIAPPDYHLLVAPGELALTTDAPVRFSRPSIDVMFESAAEAYGAAVVAVVLTGANQDGSLGATSIARAGGRILVQDPGTAEARTMPAAAARLERAEVMTLEGIADALSAACQAGNGTRLKT